MSSSTERRLEDLMASLRGDPLEFVRVCFPWGERGELEGHAGPNPWQSKVLAEIRDGLKSPGQVIREAVAAGNGVGKSAIVAWILLWGMSTFPGTKVVVTANTEGQLRTKTWPELSRWHRLFIANHWFRMTATGLYSADPLQEREWRADAIPWSETNPQAFAGLHNHGKRLILIMDEASEIDDVIWATAEGAMTDDTTQILWLVFGNPTRNTGRFRDCFDRLAHRWKYHNVDSRLVPTVNRRQIDEWATDYGEDDDWFRVHVRGQFPRFGSRQFISREIVSAAASPSRDIIPTVFDPLIMGVDVARFGSNETVIRFRRGKDARSIPPTRMNNVDTMTVAAKIISLYEEYHPDSLQVDEGGVGGGVVDRLRMLKLPVLGVQFGSRASNNRDEGHGRNNYYNLRSQMYGLLKDWLETGMIDNDRKLIEGLVAPEYTYRTVDGVDCILLEKKEDIKRRLGDVSLDDSDSLAITFSYPVQISDHTGVITGRVKSGFESQYDPMASAWGIVDKQETQRKQSWLPGSPWGSF